MPGYSQKSLADKLGIKSGMTARFINAPSEYFNSLGPLNGIHLVDEGAADFIHVFTLDRDMLSQMAGVLEGSLSTGGILWVSWPKKSSGVKANIGEQDLRDILLPTGLVDVKIAAITDVWSGLKFLRRRIH